MRMYVAAMTSVVPDSGLGHTEHIPALTLTLLLLGLLIPKCPHGCWPSPFLGLCLKHCLLCETLADNPI